MHKASIFLFSFLCLNASWASPSMLILKNVSESDPAGDEEIRGCQWDVVDLATRQSKTFLKTKTCPDWAAWNFSSHKVYFASASPGETFEASWPSAAAFQEKKIREPDLNGIETLFVDRGTNKLRLLSRKLGTTTIQTHEYQNNGVWKSTETQQNSVVADMALSANENGKNVSHTGLLNGELRASSRASRIPASVAKRAVECQSKENRAKACLYLPLSQKRGVLLGFEGEKEGHPKPPVFFCSDDCKSKVAVKNEAWADFTFRLASVRGDYVRLDRWIYKFGQPKPYMELPVDETSLEPIWFEAR